MLTELVSKVKVTNQVYEEGYDNKSLLVRQEEGLITSRQKGKKREKLLQKRKKGKKN